MNRQSAQSKTKSFRGQLTTIFTLGILALGLAGAVSSAWVTKVHIEGQLYENGLQVTESLAKQSVLALIYDSPENAEEATVAAMGFPAIEQVAILDINGGVLLVKGDPSVDYDLSALSEGVTLVNETLDYWLFGAPVFIQQEQAADQSPLLLDTEQQQELVGRVLVRKSKEKIGQVFTAAIINNLAIGLLFALVLLAILHLSFNRLVTPLDKLAAVMGRAKEGDVVKAYASLEGPREVTEIAQAYNTMIEALARHQAQLKRHNELLEYEVEERTRDLVYARDMAIRANRNKSHFLSNVSHELRTPLQSILGYSDLILETLPAELAEIHRDIDTIVLNAESLLHMINSILDMSKIEAGRIELTKQETNLDELVDGVIETIKPLITPNQNTLKLERRLIKTVVYVDGDKLRQVLLNLLGNAAKFTDNGTILFSMTQNDKLLEFKVEDNGIGMNQDQLDHIFEPFYQIDGGHTRRYQGTGLGLAITHQFCHLMNGNIKVRSEPNRGTRFYVQIPYD
ncbi:hypothetical protein Tel_14300 [Candidatus Tenderia electrophaga]|jgi:signal transduction histidine kinase|uniref:histidine kinase n=1 Tax=Candidatus Tenderia electrophaga TaxID=1748243 RepID=A0A0S2TGC8_9GAMM|nr:hypothetical protein Tel_14300 [Candidatus Tenderia electrophaga]